MSLYHAQKQLNRRRSGGLLACDACGYRAMYPAALAAHVDSYHREKERMSALRKEERPLDSSALLRRARSRSRGAAATKADGATQPAAAAATAAAAAATTPRRHPSVGLGMAGPRTLNRLLHDVPEWRLRVDGAAAALDSVLGLPHTDGYNKAVAATTGVTAAGAPPSPTPTKRLVLQRPAAQSPAVPAVDAGFWSRSDGRVRHPPTPPTNPTSPSHITASARCEEIAAAWVGSLRQQQQQGGGGPPSPGTSRTIPLRDDWVEPLSPPKPSPTARRAYTPKRNPACAVVSPRRRKKEKEERKTPRAEGVAKKGAVRLGCVEVVEEGAGAGAGAEEKGVSPLRMPGGMSVLESYMTGLAGGGQDSLII